MVVEAERREEGEAVLLHIQRDLCLSLSALRVRGDDQVS